MRGTVMKKFAITAASAMLGATLLFTGSIAPAYATTKVDCDAVMNEINSGKHAKEVAKDLNISTSSVYRCKKHAKEAARASSKAVNGGKEVPPSAMASPAAPTAKAKMK
jgi:hypothetical protein